MLRVKHERHFINRRSIGHADDAVHRHVREKRNLGALAFRNHAFGAAEQDVRIDAFFAKLLHGVLRGLRLQFARRRNPGAKREMNEAGVVAADAEGHLAHGFNEGERLDVADRAADFDHADVGLAVPGGRGAAGDEFLNFIRDVRNHLHGLAEVLAAAFLAQNAFVDLAGREVVGLVHLRRDEALIVPEVQVRFRAVFRHEHFTVLEGRHRARVDIDVRIELDHRHLQTARFEDGRQRSGGDALPERGDNAAGHKYVLGHENSNQRENKLRSADYTKNALAAAAKRPAISGNASRSARSCRELHAEPPRSIHSKGSRPCFKEAQAAFDQTAIFGAANQ